MTAHVFKLFGSPIEIYAATHDRETIVFERCPVPGGADIAVCSRRDSVAAITAAVEIIRVYGSSFKLMRSVVGHRPANGRGIDSEHECG